MSLESAHGSVGESFTNTSTHDGQTGNVLRNLGESREQQGNVGQCAGCNNPWCTLGVRHEGIPHGQNGVLVCDRGRRGLGQEVGTVQTRVTYISQRLFSRASALVKEHSSAMLTVDIGRMESGSAEGLLASGVHGDLWPADGLQDPSGIDSGVLQGGIAVNGGNTEKLQRGMVCSKENGESILYMGQNS